MMKHYLLFGLSLALFISGAKMATITVKNNCPYTIWPATLTGGSGAAQLPNTGFELGSGKSSSIDVPTTWTAGVIWARTQCSTSSGFSCETADCGSGQVACNGKGAAKPVSLAEFTLADPKNNNQDTYDVSLVDGFNVPVSITPQGGSGGTCITISCKENLNAACRSELVVRNSNGDPIGCKSACEAFPQPQYCCTPPNDKPETCPPSEYSKFFKDRCPQAYTYAYDDETSTFSCTGRPNYLVTFCP